MNKDRAMALLQEQLERVDEMRPLNDDAPDFKKWRRDTEVAIENVFGNQGRQLADFTDVTFFSMDIYASVGDNKRAYLSGLDDASSVLKSLLDEIKKFWADDPDQCSVSSSGLTSVYLISERFHTVARQLRKRHGERETLDIGDEYDVQDLFHALLRLFFDDVRPEEYTPSYAGKNSRVDFLIKRDNIFVEIKKTRKGLADKEIGEQLLIDIARYADHPNCNQLVCFIYDPDGRISNAAGLISDIESKQDWVKVIIKPE
jgi:hypothetical protein